MTPARTQMSNWQVICWHYQEVGHLTTETCLRNSFQGQICGCKTARNCWGGKKNQTCDPQIHSSKNSEQKKIVPSSFNYTVWQTHQWHEGPKFIWHRSPEIKAARLIYTSSGSGPKYQFIVYEIPRAWSSVDVNESSINWNGESWCKSV